MISIGKTKCTSEKGLLLDISMFWKKKLYIGIMFQKLVNIDENFREKVQIKIGVSLQPTGKWNERIN